MQSRVSIQGSDAVPKSRREARPTDDDEEEEEEEEEEEGAYEIRGVAARLCVVVGGRVNAGDVRMYVAVQGMEEEALARGDGSENTRCRQVEEDEGWENTMHGATELVFIVEGGGRDVVMLRQEGGGSRVHDVLEAS